MSVIYQTIFNQVGNLARDALEENMLITFKQGAPADLEAYCFIHPNGELTADIKPGDILEIDDIEYPITAVGNVASFNLKELGHVTWRFDGIEEAEFPGTIHVRGEIPMTVDVGSVLKVYRV